LSSSSSSSSFTIFLSSNNTANSNNQQQQQVHKPPNTTAKGIYQAKCHIFAKSSMILRIPVGAGIEVRVVCGVD